mgnify:CR=1 FL=1
MPFDLGSVAVKKPVSFVGKTRSAGGVLVKKIGCRVARFQAAIVGTGGGVVAAEDFSAPAGGSTPVTNQRSSGEKTSGGAALWMACGSGGGVNGQAGAMRLGISRALVAFNAELRKALKKDGLLTRAQSLEGYFAEAVHSLKGEPNVIDIRNVGLVGGVELAPIAGEPAKRAFSIFLDCWDKGLLIQIGRAHV